MDALGSLLAADLAKLLAIAIVLMLLVAIVVLRHKGRTLLSIGNGNGNRTSSTAQLQARDVERWKTIEDEIKRHGRDLYEIGGAVRLGDHNVRNEVTTVILRSGAATDDRIKELRTEIRDDMAALRKELAEHSQCCQHCP